ncbi:hypothetical protein Tco_0045977, partial [Tanacetum coccineum]
IKKLERKAKSSIQTPKRRLYKHVDSSDDILGEENASKQGRNDSNKTEEFNLSDKGSGRTEVFDDTTAAEKDVNAAEPVSTAGDAVTAASIILDIDTAGPSNVSAAGPFTSTAGDIFEDKMMTIADTLVAIRTTRPRTTSVVIHDVEEKPRRATPEPTVQSQDKGKSKILEPEPTPKKPIKAQIQKDTETAQRLFEEDQAHEEQSAEKEKELSEEELQKLLVIVPIEELVIQPLQVRYPIIDWEVYSEDTRKERFCTAKPIDDKEKELSVELKRLFEPDNDDILWKLQRYMHDPLVWRLYDTCGVHHVSSVRGHDIFMLVEKEYPLTRGTLGLMMVARLLVEADSEMSRELLRKIFYQVNRPRHYIRFNSET